MVGLVGSVIFSPYTIGFPAVGSIETLSAPASFSLWAVYSAHFSISSAYAESALMLGILNRSKSSSKNLSWLFSMYCSRVISWANLEIYICNQNNNYIV